MLIIGRDTYVVVAQADDYIQKHFMPMDEFRVFWEALASEEKEVYLRKSCAQIERLPFPGRKRYYMQDMQFPRDTDDVPKDVELAQVYNALGFFNEHLVNSSCKQINTLKSLGVIRAPSFVLNAGESIDFQGLKSKRAAELLEKYRCGSYIVR